MITTLERPVAVGIQRNQLVWFPEKFEVEVTEEDIKAGQRGHSNECAVALAVGRMFPASKPSVHHWGTYIRHGSSWAGYSHDAEAFIGAFDQGYAVKPCTVHFRHIEGERC